METTAQDTATLSRSSSNEIHLSNVGQLSAVCGLVVLALTILACIYMPASTRHFKRISDDGLYKQSFLRLDVIMGGVFISALFLTSAARVGIARIRPQWRSVHTCAALGGICVFLCVFIVHFGRWQFGAFDFNIILEMGWRQILGQRPFVDFPATTPPGFNLGTKYAFELFGVSWNANLYWAAIFSCATFLWMYWLMRRLAMGRLASAGVALAIECAAMLTLCFWWYNNSALISAAVFFLSCFAFREQPLSPFIQVSYVASLALLSLMKPNIAGLTITASVLLLFLVTKAKLRLVVLTLCATVLAIGLLALNRVPVLTMLRSYLSVAHSRGSVGSRFGYNLMNEFEANSALFWVAALAVPLAAALLIRGYKLLRAMDVRGFGVLLFFVLVAPSVALYGLATNGEFRDAECTLMLAAVGVLTFGRRWSDPLSRRFAIAIICASIACDLYYGATRARVYGIGPHLFFEWHDNQHRIGSGVLKNMRVSGPFITVENEVTQAVKASRGPYFFGPRLDFNYAVFGIPSPAQFPAWWHPGTSFPESAQSKIIEQWQQDHFETLIFVKTGFAGYGPDRAYTYYPQEFMDAIHSEYQPDDSYSAITVYHRK